MSLAFLTLPYLIVYLTVHLPLLDLYLDMLQLPQTGLQSYVTPEATRAAEMILGLLLPAVVYSFLPAYRRFSSEPDETDEKRSKSNMDSVTHSRRLSEASLDIYKGSYA